MKKIIFLLGLFFSTLLFGSGKQPKLIVQIVIDQLRGDLIELYQKKFTSDGFNYLLNHGLNYRNAHHPHAYTVTCVGHASIATGADPAFHGIIANDWYDRQTRLTPYCVSDPKSMVLPTPRTQKILEGRSPLNLISSTFSDELILAQKGRAFAVSLKDRAAITLAGHAGKAFWFDKENGGFITSTFYYRKYPHWVSAWNKAYESKELEWTPTYSLEYYHFRKAPRFINQFPGFGNNFRHKTGTSTTKNYYKHLSMTPFADELTADFAIHLLNEEKLGKNEDKTDYLAISFSATDAIGHHFGPNSLESEDNLFRLDKTLAQLLKAIDKQVGLMNAVIILTADHGVSDSPVYLAKHHMAENPSLNFLNLRNVIEQALAQRFHLPANALEAIMPPYIYLNHPLLSANHLTLSEVSGYLAKVLSQQAGIFKAYDLPIKDSQTDWLSIKVGKMAYQPRVGDIYLIPLAYGGLGNKNTGRVSHGTPWNYDSFVPLLFVNPSFKAKAIYKSTRITEIAPTLAALLGIRAPSASVDQPLSEVLDELSR